MKTTRTLLSVLTLTLAFSMSPSAMIHAEEGSDEPIDTVSEYSSTETEQDDKVIVRSIFLASENDADQDPEANAILVAEKETAADAGMEIHDNYNLRAPANDEFALYHDGAILNDDHYRLSQVVVNNHDEAPAAENNEENNSEMTLIYTFEQPWYNVTIHYEDIETGEQLFEPEVQTYPGSTKLKGPVSYDVKDFVNIQFEGYTFRSVSGDTLIGEVDTDKDIRILYEKNK